jgi:type I restriction enzyme M protein
MPSTALGFEDELWEAADALRGRMDASTYKHCVLGLLFLKLAADAWSIPGLQFAALTPDGLNRAAEAIEGARPELNGAVPRLAGTAPDHVLTSLLERLAALHVDPEQDTLGRVYEYFLRRFAASEGRTGGEFYTPGCVVRLLVALVRPQGVVYDPCCGTGGMFVQARSTLDSSSRLVGQESNPRTWRLARQNLALAGLSADLAQPADSLHDDQHPSVRANAILANPPFNLSSWRGKELADDPRWRYGRPPVGNANFAWVQHMVHHLAPGGTAGFILANGSLSNTRGGTGAIRLALVEAGLVDTIVALPTQLFYGTTIPAALWILRKDRKTKDTLFVDASAMGRMETRVHRVLDTCDIERITAAHASWEAGQSARQPDFCATAGPDRILAEGGVLTPGRYIPMSASQPADEGELARLQAELLRLLDRSADLDVAVRAALKSLT